MQKKVINIAHRGFSGKFPENTMLAFREALSLGVDMIELDVHLSKDRKVVVHHDDELGRTAAGTGLIKDHTLKELKALDAGSWFDQKYSAERIPLLEEVLDIMDGPTKLNIEIKSAAYEEEETPDGIEHQIAALVRKKGMEEKVVVSSFQVNCLRRLNQISNAPQVIILDLGIEKKLDLIEEIRPVSYNTYYWRLSLEDIDTVHQAGASLNVFTVNNRTEMETMIRMGVDGIITNTPHLLKKIFLDRQLGHTRESLW
ncbi:MAG: glycerophosphodiester phosphodiesterase [SAR324 cluster bacterium]|nr:glycerophosphodiester phosphodiesterase [SAR324 cluster bacterium]